MILKNKIIFSTLIVGILIAILDSITCRLWRSISNKFKKEMIVNIALICITSCLIKTIKGNDLIILNLSNKVHNIRNDPNIIESLIILGFYPNNIFNIDGISVLLIIIVVYFNNINSVNNLYTVTSNSNVKLPIVYIFNLMLILLFISNSIFSFMFLFEIVSLPLIIRIYLWGPRTRKKRAISYIYRYSTISIFLLVIAISINISETNNRYSILINYNEYSINRQNIIMWRLLIPFFVKMPRMPFHLWLPEAHVESATFTSVILAAIMLKVSIFGIYRFMLYNRDMIIQLNLNIILSLFIISSTYATLSTLRQNDIKRIIAYSSIVHMNFSSLGLFSYSLIGVNGALIMMRAHAISSSALFIIVGRIYIRIKSKNIFYITGIKKTSPILSRFFRVFILGNIGFPFTLNFISEIMIIMGISNLNFIIILISRITLVISIRYSLWLFTRTNYNSSLMSNKNYILLDLNRHEFIILISLTLSLILLGIYPRIINNRL